MEASNSSSRELHLSFVEMLFALAIGQVAISVSDLIDLKLQHGVGIAESLPAFSHLLLAAAVIAASWVGWRNSKSSGTPIKSVFSLDFIILIVDVLLVVCYFLLVRLVELPRFPSYEVVPDASVESWIVMVIMAMYVVWDFLSCRSDASKLGKRVWASVTCFGMSLLILWILPRYSHCDAAVILIDVSLLALVFTFRAMKLHDWGEHTPGSKLAIGVSTFVLLASSILACRVA